MKKIWGKGKRHFTKALAGVLAALMVVTLVPVSSIPVKAEVPADAGFAKSILDDAINYGILADKITQVQHMQTNYAVNEFIMQPYSVNNDPDLLSDSVIVPFYAAKITGNVRLDNFNSSTKTILYHVGAGYRDRVNIKYGAGYQTIIDDSQSSDDIKRYVDGMLGKIKTKSDNINMFTQTTITPNCDNKNNYTLNTNTNEYDDNAVIYVSVPSGSNLEAILKVTGGLTIEKKEKQVIVFNLEGTEIELDQFNIKVGTNKIEDSTGNQQLGSKNTFLSNQVMGKIIWNMPNAASVKLRNSAGMFLATKPGVEVVLENTTTGWMVANGTFTQKNGEWHFPWTIDLDSTVPQTKIGLVKKYYEANGTTESRIVPSVQAQFQLLKSDFTLKKEESVISDSTTGLNMVTFTVDYPDAAEVYYLKESAAANGYLLSDVVYECTVQTDGTVTYKAGTLEGNTFTPGASPVIDGKTGYVICSNTKDGSSGEVANGKITIKKNIGGTSKPSWDAIKNNIEFAVKDSTNKVRVFISGNDEGWSSEGADSYSITFDVPAGSYTVEEVNNGLNEKGKIGDTSYSVSTTPSSGSDSVTVTEGSRESVEFTNTYSTLGSIQLEKKIDQGELNEWCRWDSLSGNIKFKVLKEGDDSFEKIINASSFEKTDDYSGKIVINDLAPGKYTVQEIADGYNWGNKIWNESFTVETTCDPGLNTDKKAEVTVSGGQTKTVKFTNKYIKSSPDPQNGKLTIRKKVAGDLSISDWDKVKDKISFKITCEADNVNFTREIKGSELPTFNSTEQAYEITYSDLYRGTYTVKETCDEIDGYQEAVVQYTLDASGTTKDSNNADVVVDEANSERIVTFTNTYNSSSNTPVTPEKGSIKIIKKISGLGDTDKAKAMENIAFTVKDNNLYLVTSTKLTNGVASGTNFTKSGDDYIYVIDDLELNKLYTIEETGTGLDSDGKINEKKYTVSVGAQTQNGTSQAKPTEAKPEAEITFTNTYTLDSEEMETLTLQKKITDSTSGLVWQNFAQDVEFVIKKKDGGTFDYQIGSETKVTGVTKLTVTGDKFSPDDLTNKIYSLKVNLSKGEYTIKETKDGSDNAGIKDIYSVSTTSTVNATTGSTTAEVDLTTAAQTVLFTNAYSKIAVSPIKISKRAVTGTAELSGATLTLYEDKYEDTVPSGATVVETWETKDCTTGPKEISGDKLKKDTIYTLVETAAPDGYKIATNIIFRIDADGKVTAVDSYPLTLEGTDNRTIVMFDEAEDDIQIQLTKKFTGTISKDSALTTVYALYSDENCTSQVGENVTPVSSGSGSYTVTFDKVTHGLEKNKVYYLTEVTAPTGYKKSDAVYKCAVDADGNVTYTLAKGDTTNNQIVSGKPVCTNVEQKGSVEIKGTKKVTGKIAAATGKSFTIKMGKYEGEKLIEEKTKTVEAGAGFSFEDKYDSKDIGKTYRYVLKEDSNNPIAGVIYDNTTYTVKVAITAGGATSETLTVTVKEGNLTGNDFTNHFIEDLTIKKVNNSNALLGGAELELYEGTFTGTPANATKVGATITTSGTQGITIEGAKLKANTNYTLVERKAPTGYGYANNIIFKVEADGKLKVDSTYLSSVNTTTRVITMKDAAVDNIKLIKTFTGTITAADAQTAVFGLYSDADCKKEVLRRNPASTGSGYTVTFEGSKINAGTTYYLKEISAPTGYTASSTVFKCEVKKDGTVAYSIKGGSAITTTFPECENVKQIPDLSISKKKLGGNEISGAKMELHKADSRTETLKSSTLLEGEYGQWTSQSGASKTIPGSVLEPGKTYTLRETLAPKGYAKVTTDIVFSIDADGNVTVEKSPVGYSEYDKNTRTLTMFDAAIKDIELTKKFVDDTDAATTISETLAQTATFGLYQSESDSSLIRTVKVAKSGTNYKVIFPGGELESGKVYYLKEISAPAGYTKSDDIFRCTVLDDGSIKYEKKDGNAYTVVPSLECKNVKDAAVSKVGFIQFNGKKVLNGDTAPDETYQFTLSENGAVIQQSAVTGSGDFNFLVKYENDQALGEHTYVIAEKAGTTDGMVYDTKTYTVKVSVADNNNTDYSVSILSIEDGTGTSITAITNYVYTFTNTYTEPANNPGTPSGPTSPATPTTPSNPSTPSGPAAPAKKMDPVVVHKKFEDGKTGAYNGEPSGSRFTLFTDPSCSSAIDDAKNVEVFWSEADKEWKAYIQSGIVPPGNTYYLKETTAPNGYKIDKTIYEIIVDSNGKVSYRIAGSSSISTSMTSTAKLTKGVTTKSPKTGDYYNYGLPIAVIVLLGAASILCFVRSRKKEEE